MFYIKDMSLQCVLDKIIIFIGFMGVGKIIVGCCLVQVLDLLFCDVDEEIEWVVGCMVSEIFVDFGEIGFCEGECKVIVCLLQELLMVFVLGGGVFVDLEMCVLIKVQVILIWLIVDVDMLVV